MDQAGLANGCHAAEREYDSLPFLHFYTIDTRCTEDCRALVRSLTHVQLGEYSFCFDNAENKLVDFDIMVESEPRRMISAQQPALKEHTSALEESTYKINGLLSSIVRSQK